MQKKYVGISVFVALVTVCLMQWSTVKADRAREVAQRAHEALLRQDAEAARIKQQQAEKQQKQRP